MRATEVRRSPYYPANWRVFLLTGLVLIGLVYMTTLSGKAGGEDEELFAANLPEHLRDVTNLYVIPGGGTGDGVEGVKDRYPEWTRRRVVAAYEYSKKMSKNGLFLALSAGSLNTANSLLPDGRVKFECQHTINHLVELGVAPQSIVGDWFSWDTVSNALFLRMVVSGVKASQRKALRGSSHKLPVDVFISDFHADRVQAAFHWVLGLKPSLLPGVTLSIHKVSSEGIPWPSKEIFDARVAHEAKGVEQIQANALKIRTAQELYAFLLLGPHRGFFDYLHGKLPLKKGSGW